MIINLRFNNDEDTGLNIEGSVTLPNDMNVGGINTIAIRGLAEWRNVPADIVYVSKSFIEGTNLAVKMKGKGVKYIGFKNRSDWDILLPYALREKGEQAVIAQLKKFFTAFSRQATVKLGVSEDSMEVDEPSENKDE